MKQRRLNEFLSSLKDELTKYGLLIKASILEQKGFATGLSQQWLEQQQAYHNLRQRGIDFNFKSRKGFDNPEDSLYSKKNIERFAKTLPMNAFRPQLDQLVGGDLTQIPIIENEVEKLRVQYEISQDPSDGIKYDHAKNIANGSIEAGKMMAKHKRRLRQYDPNI